MNFHINRKEKGRTVVSLFRGLSANNLMHAHASTCSETGQILAVILINKAIFDEGEIANDKSDLIKYANNRKKQETLRKKAEGLVPISHFTPLMEAESEVQEFV